MSRPIIIIAGEPSADMHGASLVRHLSLLDKNLEFHGIGSTQMQKAGVSIFADLAQYAVIGFIEVLKHYSIFKKAFDLALMKISQINPEAVILIDYPGFNLRLAKKIKRLFPGIKIIYYISPQVWAWGQKRISLIKEVVDKMLVVFDFEARMYAGHGIDAEFVGHPLIESVRTSPDQNEQIKKFGFKNNDIVITMLPGSRQIEVKRILPVMLASAEIIHNKMPEIKFALIKAANISQTQIEDILAGHSGTPVTIVDSSGYDIISFSSYAWVCSGTATLETAILGVPMLITYKTSLFTWLVSKMLIKLPYIGLVNVVAGKKIVPEFIQGQSNPQTIAAETSDFFSKDKHYRLARKQELLEIKTKLGQGHVDQNAAQAILSFINKNHR